MSASERNNDQVDVDTFVALQRCSGDKESVRKIEESLWRHVGEEQCGRLSQQAATRRLLHEFREAEDKQRDICLDIVCDALAKGADANAQEESPNAFEFEVTIYQLSALQLLVTNSKVSTDNMCSIVAAMIENQADVNAETNSETPLLLALQARCVAGVEALATHGAKMTPDALDELRGLSHTKVRHEIEDSLKPLIYRDRSLRCPLWVWVQFGATMAVEALLRNASHEEEVDSHVLVALQRCRKSGETDGDTEAVEKIAEMLREHVGEEEFRRLEQIAATRRLLQEVREAHTDERDLDLEVLCDTLARGANPNTVEGSLDEDDEDGNLDEEEEDAGEDAEEEDEEEEDEGEGEEVDGDEESESTARQPEEEDEEDGEDDDEEEEGEPEEELDGEDYCQ